MILGLTISALIISCTPPNNQPENPIIEENLGPGSHPIGVQIFSGKLKGVSSSLILINEENTKVPKEIPIEQIKIAQNKIGKYSHMINREELVCGDKSVQIHNYLELLGIETGIAVLIFQDNPIAHMINTFREQNSIIVYIDATGLTSPEPTRIYPIIGQTITEYPGNTILERIIILW